MSAPNVIASILIGNVVRLTCEFVVEGEPATPSTVRFVVRHQAGERTVIDTQQPTSAVVTTTFEPDLSGRWTVRVEADDPDAAVEGVIDVAPSRIPTTTEP